MTTDQLDEEVDLLELLETLWQGKWFIIFATAIGSILTALFLFIMPTVFKVEMVISQLSPQQISAYAPLNNVPGISPPIYAGENLIGHEGVIDSGDLFAAVVTDVTSGKNLRAALNETDPAFQYFEGSAEEKANALIEAASDFKIIGTRTDAGRYEDAKLVIESSDLDMTEGVLRKYVELVTNDIRKQNLIAIANLSKSIKSSLKYEIETLETEIAGQKQHYFDMLNARMAVVSEQAKIARALGLAEPAQNTLVRTTFSSGTGDLSTSSEPDQMFMLGYKALEAEKGLLAKRKESNWQFFTPGYPDLARQLRALQNDSRVSRVEAGLTLSPLSDPDLFIPANFNLDGITSTPRTNRLLILVLMGLIFSIAASIFILARQHLGTRPSAEA